MNIEESISKQGFANSDLTELLVQASAFQFGLPHLIGAALHDGGLDADASADAAVEASLELVGAAALGEAMGEAVLDVPADAPVLGAHRKEASDLLFVCSVLHMFNNIKTQTDTPRTTNNKRQHTPQLRTPARRLNTYFGTYLRILWSCSAITHALARNTAWSMIPMLHCSCC